MMQRANAMPQTHDHVARPSAPDWHQTRGTYIAGRAYLDGADQTAAEMEAKWGADRLRLLVGPELREKFDRQRYLLNQAIWHGDLEGVKRESQRMVRAWLALDTAATQAGAAPLPPEVWEVALENGKVVAVVRSLEDAHRVVAEGRNVRVYTLAEIGRLLEAFPGIAEAKVVFPGAEVVRAEKRGDPLDSIRDSNKSLDDPLDDDFQI